MPQYLEHGSRKEECNGLIADPAQGRASKMFMDYKTPSALFVCQGLQTNFIDH